MADPRFLARKGKSAPLIAVLVFAISIEVFLQIGALQPLRVQAHEKLIIFAAPHFSLIAISFLKHSGPKHHRRMDIRRVSEKIMRTGSKGHPHMAPCAGSVDQLAAAPDPCIAGMVLQKVMLALQPARIAVIIGVHARQIRTAAVCDGRVERGWQPLMHRQTDETNARIEQGCLFDPAPPFSACPIIDHDQLPFLKGLGDDGQHCLKQHLTADGLIDAHDHADLHFHTS